MKIIYIEDKTDSEIDDIIYNAFRGVKTIYNRRDRLYYLKCGAGFDIETSEITLNSGDIATYCYHWQMSINTTIIGGRSLDTMVKAFSHIAEYLKKRRAFLLVLDANLGYEYQFCKRYWIELGMSNLFAKEKRQPLKVVISNCIEVREILGLFGHSLADVAKHYTETQKLKGDLDFSKCRLSNTPMTKKEIDYCYNDVKILTELGEYIFNHYYGKNPSLPLTSTGIIRAKVKNRCKDLKARMQRIHDLMPDENLYNEFRTKLFRGGICGTNALYMNVTLHDVICADLVSDYPACMNHYLYPMGALTEINPVNIFMENVPYIGLFEFVNVHAKTSHSLYSVHKCLNSSEIISEVSDDTSTIDNGRVYKAKSMIVYLNDIDYKAFCKAYYFDNTKSKIYKAWKFEKYARLPYYVLDILNEEYLKKQQLKPFQDEKPIEYMDAKRNVNGQFGMMCTALYMTELTISENGDISDTDENGNLLTKSYDDATKNLFLYPFWGFWITSYARYILTDVITKFPRLIIQYDTDSVYYNKNHPDSEKLTKYLEKYNEKIKRRNALLFNNAKEFETLGTWEFSKPYKTFKALGSKRYMYEKEDGTIKQVVAGCRKNAILNQYQFEKENGSTNAKTIFDFFKNRMIVDINHSGKLASIYYDGYEIENGLQFVVTGMNENTLESITIDYTDYLGNTETIKLSSCIRLKPIAFDMQLSPLHIDFYKTLKADYKNLPFGDKEIKRMLDILEGEI